jgi:glycosyltransferase involved in cell wall biosynthesis
MKILIDGRLYGLENAGLGRYVVNLVEQLAKIDTENDYVIFLRRKYFENLSLPRNWRKVLADFRHYSFAEQLRLPRLIYKEKPDIVHFPHFNVPVFFRGKYIVTIHDMLMHKSMGLTATTLPPWIYFIKRVGYRIVFDGAVKRSSAVIVPSQSVKAELLRKYALSPKKIYVTYEGCDEKISERENANIPKPYFVYAGNAYPHKNLANLIKAVKLLNTKSNQRVILAIASARNIFTQRVKKLIERDSACDFVKILGFVPDEKLGSLYKHATGFIFPSLSEGFGLPGLEAMAAGTLVAASDIPVFKEIYGEHAIYFDPTDIQSIECTLRTLLNMSEGDRNAEIRKAQNFVKRYSWTKMAEETVRVYNVALKDDRKRKQV